MVKNKNETTKPKKLKQKEVGFVKKLKKDFSNKFVETKDIIKDSKEKKNSISDDKQKKKQLKNIPTKDESSESEISPKISDNDEEFDKDENEGKDDNSSENNEDETEEGNTSQNNDMQIMDSDSIENNKVIISENNTKNVSNQQLRIMINNLPMDITLPDLLKLFSDSGPIIKVIISNPDSFEFGFNNKSNSLRAVIIFKNIDSIKNALQYNETEVKGRQILITNLSEIPRKKIKNKIRFPPNLSIYIRNMKQGTNEEHIKQFFSNCGEIKDILIKKNGQTSLRFNRTDSIPLALALNKTKLNESKILICKHKSVNPRNNSSNFKKYKENDLINKIENKIMRKLKKQIA